MIRWQKVNTEPFEYAIQQGPHGDDFVKLLNGECLRRPTQCEVQSEGLVERLENMARWQSDHMDHLGRYNNFVNGGLVKEAAAEIKRLVNMGERATAALNALAQAGLDPATIEACAQVAIAQKKTFLSEQYAANQPMGSFCERFACDEVANAIRALAHPSAQLGCGDPSCKDPNCEYGK